MKLKIKDVTGYEISWEKYHFPAGEVGFLIEHMEEYRQPLTIKADLYTSDDFNVMISLFNHFMSIGVEDYKVDFGFLAFGRQDKPKVISKGGKLFTEVPANKTLLTTMLDSMACNTPVTILDYHSDLNAEWWENGWRYNIDLDLRTPCIPYITNKVFGKKLIPLFPDEGAFYRYREVSKETSLRGVKGRNDEGKIVSFELVGEFNPKGDYCVIDDICDGGATFIQVAECMKAKGHTGELHLFVTHGLFTKGLKELQKHYTSVKVLTSKDFPELIIKNSGEN